MPFWVAWFSADLLSKHNALLFQRLKEYYTSAYLYKRETPDVTPADPGITCFIQYHSEFSPYTKLHSLIDS